MSGDAGSAVADNAGEDTTPTVRNPRIHHKKVTAFVAGITLVGALYFLSLAMQTVTRTPEFGNAKKVSVMTLLGISFGYYLGKTATGEEQYTVWFVMGILSTFIAFMLLNEKLSVFSAVLILLVTTIFLLFYSEIIEESEELESWLQSAKYASILGLLVIGFLQYGLPVLGPLADWIADALSEFTAFLHSTPSGKLWILAVLLVVSLLVLLRVFVFLSQAE